LGLALDEPAGEKDEKLESDGVSFIIDKKLSKSLREITIDYRNSWFGKGFTVRAAGAYQC
jgi:Fe-S cluster assembly iron-binding protein IscA